MTQKFAFLFPGQGSQTVGMLAMLAAEFPLVQATFAEASVALHYDLWQLTQVGPGEQLNQTEFTQPALLTASVALWRVWLAQQGPLPDYLAGHSLGEYSALVCAGALELGMAVQLVAERGRYMQAAVPAGTGAMAAIVGLEDQHVRALCVAAAQTEIVEAVNYNAIGQVVIAGHAQAVERALQAAKQAGAKLAMKLPVSAPSHCALMQPAAERLRAALEDCTLKTPSIPIINNVDVQIVQDPTAIKQALVRQLFNPVRWVETIQWLLTQSCQQFIECGPGKVLTGLNKRIDTSAQTLAINTPADLMATLTQL